MYSKTKQFSPWKNTLYKQTNRKKHFTKNAVLNEKMGISMIGESLCILICQTTV